jgi:hypothetical protein
MADNNNQPKDPPQPQQPPVLDKSKTNPADLGIFQSAKVESQRQKKEYIAAESVSHTNLYSNDLIEQWLTQGRAPKLSNHSSILVGPKCTGKTGAALSVLGDDPEEKMLCLELGRDRGVTTLKDEFWGSDDRIIVLDPYEYILEKQSNRLRVDYQATMTKIKSVLFYLKVNDWPGLHTILLDGLDALLTLAELQMRVDLDTDEASGISRRYWIRRNRYFDETFDLMMSLDLCRIFTNHFKVSRPDEIYGTRDSLQAVNQIYECTLDTTGLTDFALTATVMADRVSLANLGRKWNIAERKGQEVLWYGLPPLKEAVDRFKKRKNTLTVKENEEMKKGVQDAAKGELEETTAIKEEKLRVADTGLVRMNKKSVLPVENRPE